MLRHPARADHLDVVVHQLAGAGGVVDLNERQQILVNVANALRHLGVHGRVAPRPRHVLQRDQLHHQHAVVRGLGDGEMERGAELGGARGVIQARFGLGDDLAEPRDVVVGGVLGGKLRGEAFDGALRVHDLDRRHAAEVELHRERLGEQPRIAASDARAAALAHPDLGDAERFERAQRIARDDAADAVARRDLVLSAEHVAGLELLGKQRVAHVADDLRGQRRRAAGKEAPARNGADDGVGECLRLRGHDETYLRALS